MRVAFHFNADYEGFGRSYRWPIEEACFRFLLSQASSELHVKVFCGDLLVARFARDDKSRERIQRDIRHSSPFIRQALHPDFERILFTNRIYVLAFEAMRMRLCEALHRDLSASLPREAYLGALELHEANRVHWVLYRDALVPLYRVVGRELRILYEMSDENSRDDSLAAYWKERVPFATVEFEDRMDRGTMFDPYNSFGHAQRVANLSEVLADCLTGLADHLLMRLSDLAPHICEMLYSAFQRLEQPETTEDMAQASVSCRRILKAVADVLYPAREEKVGGHDVTDGNYRNRLWAFVRDHVSGREQELILAELEDVGNRVEKLDNLAHKGVHDRINLGEVRRLLIGEVVLLYDLLVLTRTLYPGIPLPSGKILDLQTGD